jgi:pimeloyl-ACP methyl ester carboxylesterase
VAERRTGTGHLLVVEFLSTLNVDRRITLVDNDTGRAICQLVIAEHPERIGRLVLTSCDAFEALPALAVRLPPANPDGALSGATTRLRWVVEVAEGRRGLRAGAFARIYARLVDRAWPRFVAWAREEAARRGST